MSSTNAFMNQTFWMYVVSTAVVIIVACFVLWGGGSGSGGFQRHREVGLDMVTRREYVSWLFLAYALVSYALMVWASYMIDLATVGPQRDLLRYLYTFQLLAGLMWFISFFGSKNTFTSAYGISLLWLVLNFGILLQYSRINTMYAWIFAPYFVLSAVAFMYTQSVHEVYHSGLIG